MMTFGSKTALDRCTEFLEFINRRGRASKWDLIKLAGNETAFRRWFDELLEFHKMVTQETEGRYTYYRKTQKGELLHQTLKDRHFVKTLQRISQGRRLQPEP